MKKSLILLLLPLFLVSCKESNNKEIDNLKIGMQNAQASEELKILDLTEVSPTYSKVGWGSLVINKGSDGNKLSLNDNGNEIVYEKGYFAHAYSTLMFDRLYSYNLTNFSVKYGTNVTSRNSSVTKMKFYIYFDQELVHESDTILGNSNQVEFNYEFKDKINTITLVISDLGGNGNDHGVWAEPILKYLE